MRELRHRSIKYADSGKINLERMHQHIIQESCEMQDRTYFKINRDTQ